MRDGPWFVFTDSRTGYRYLVRKTVIKYENGKALYEINGKSMVETADSNKLISVSSNALIPATKEDCLYLKPKITNKKKERKEAKKLKELKRKNRNNQEEEFFNYE